MVVVGYGYDTRHTHAVRTNQMFPKIVRRNVLETRSRIRYPHIRA